MKTLNDYLMTNGLYDDEAMVQDAMREYGITRRIAQDTERTPIEYRDLLIAARTHNIQVEERRQQGIEVQARAILLQDSLSHDDWRFLVQHDYARFNADEASADGALWNVSYSLTSKGQALL